MGYITNDEDEYHFLQTQENHFFLSFFMRLGSSRLAKFQTR